MKTNIIVQDTANNIATFSIIRNKTHEIRGQIVMLDFFREYLEHKKELEKPRTLIGFKQNDSVTIKK